jgi:hypothetical protein
MSTQERYWGCVLIVCSWADRRPLPFAKNDMEKGREESHVAVLKSRYQQQRHYALLSELGRVHRRPIFLIAIFLSGDAGVALFLSGGLSQDDLGAIIRNVMKYPGQASQERLIAEVCDRGNCPLRSVRPERARPPPRIDRNSRTSTADLHEAPFPDIVSQLPPALVP